MLLNSPLFLIILIIIIINVLLALFVFISDAGWKKIINRRFFVFALATSFWLTVNLISFLDINNALVWQKLSFVVGIIATYFLLRFVIVFPSNMLTKKSSTKILEYIGFAISLVGISISFSNQLVKTVVAVGGLITITYGFFYNIYIIVLIALVIMVSYFLYKNYKIASKLERSQIKTMMYGVGIMFFIIISVVFISPILFGNDYLSNFDIFGVVFLIGFTAYAIVKHQAFDIKVILTQTAVAIVLIAIFIQTVLSANTNDFVLNILILIIAIYGSYLIVKSVQQEIKRREEMKILSDQLTVANLHLKELDAMKTEFVSLASHELLTPVSAIEGYLSMLLDEKMAKVEDPKALKYMDHVYTSAKRLARLVTDMLNVSRIEEGRLLVEKKEVNLIELIQQVIAEIKFKADEKKQKIIFEKPSFAKATEGASTYGDADKLKEVIINLIGNSIKYSKNPGTISINIEKVPTPWVAEKWQKVESEIKARPLDDQEAIKSVADEHFHALVGPEQLLIAVSDEGIGIPKEELPRLFKKFHRVGDYTTAESQGTGLGLYISRALVELHHGRIWADSEGSGKGSTFTFTLPDISDKEELLKMESQAPKKESLKPLARPVKQAEDI